MNGIKTILLTASVIISLSLTAGKTTKLFVADHKDYCNATTDDECLLVKTNSNDTWQASGAIIDGFTYAEGYEYQLKVKDVTTDKDSVKHYKLSKVLSKVKTDFKPTDVLYNKQWFLHTMFEDTTFINLVDTTVIYMKIDTPINHVLVRGVCNTMMGSAKADGYKLSFSAFSSTKVACKANTLESIIGAMFEKMTDYKVRGNVLTLYSGKSAMVFKYNPPTKK
jgi:hypothetical protein